MAWWLKIYLPMQVMWVQSLVRELRYHMQQGNEVCELQVLSWSTLEPVICNKRSVCPTTRETPPMHRSEDLVQLSCSVVSDSATSWTAARQASLSITNFWNLPKLMSTESVMPSNHLIFCCPLLFLLCSVFPSIRVFSNESALHIR